VISFQAACWDDPEKLFGSQGFRLPVDPESQKAVFFADAEPKDLLQMEEAAHDVLAFFIVNRCDVAPVVFAFSIFRSKSKGEATGGEPGGETRSGDNRKETS